MLTKPDCDICRKVQRFPKCDECIPYLEPEYEFLAEVYLMTWDQMRFPGGPYNTSACVQYLQAVGVIDRRTQVQIIDEMRKVHGPVMEAVLMKTRKGI